MALLFIYISKRTKYKTILANFFSSLLLIILPLKHFTIKQKNFDKVTIDQLFFINRASDPFILLKWHVNVRTAY